MTREDLRVLLKSGGGRYASSIRRCVRYVGNRLADRVLGIESTDTLTRQQLGFGIAERSGYAPTSWLSLLQLRRVLNGMQVTSDDVFLDYGSGKGRVVRLAAAYPFRRVIGVELSAALNEIARRNLARRDSLACGDVRLECVDASMYRLPDEVSIIYMFNPFEGKVFSRVVDEILASITRQPRVVIVIYHNPTMATHLIERGFRVIQTAPRLRVYVAPAASLESA